MPVDNVAEQRALSKIMSLQFLDALHCFLTDDKYAEDFTVRRLKELGVKGYSLEGSGSFFGTPMTELRHPGDLDMAVVGNVAPENIPEVHQLTADLFSKAVAICLGCRMRDIEFEELDENHKPLIDLYNMKFYMLSKTFSKAEISDIIDDADKYGLDERDVHILRNIDYPARTEIAIDLLVHKLQPLLNPTRFDNDAEVDVCSDDVEMSGVVRPEHRAHSSKKIVMSFGRSSLKTRDLLDLHLMMEAGQIDTSDPILRKLVIVELIAHKVKDPDRVDWLKHLEPGPRNIDRIHDDIQRLYEKGIWNGDTSREFAQHLLENAWNLLTRTVGAGVNYDYIREFGFSDDDSAPYKIGLTDDEYAFFTSITRASSRDGHARRELLRQQDHAIDPSLLFSDIDPAKHPEMAYLPERIAHDPRLVQIAEGIQNQRTEKF